MHKASRLLQIATAVAAVLTAASLERGLLQTAPQPGVTWRVRRAARSETALVARATIPRTGTTRESPWTQTILTGSSSIRSTSGLQRAQELSGTIPPAVTRIAAAQVPFTWINMLSHSCPDHPAFWQSETM